MKQRIASDSLYSAISGLCFITGNFVSGIIVANYLGVDGTGIFYFFIALITVLSTALDGGTASSLVRFQGVLQGQKDASAAYALAGKLARRLAIYIAFGLLLFFCFFSISRGSLPDGYLKLDQQNSGAIETNAFLLLGITVCVQTLAMSGTAYLRGVRFFGALAWLSMFSMTTQLLLVLAGTHIVGVNGAILGYGLGQAALAVTTLTLLFRRGHTPQSLRQDVGRYQRYAWAANLCNIFVWSRIEIFFLQFFWSSREVGLFSIALALAALASQGPLLLTGAFLPMLSEKHGRGDHAGLQRAFSGGTRLLAMFAFPACIGMVAVVPSVVELIYGPQFLPAIPASMLICAAAAASITTVIGTHLVNALARSDFIFYCSLLGALLSVLFGLFLIPALGLLGAAVARTTTQLIMVGLGIWFVSTKLGFTYPFAQLMRIFMATLPAALGAYIAVKYIDGVPGLIAAIGLFIPLYLTGLRLFAAMPQDDLDLLLGLSRSLPRFPARLARHLLLVIVPNAAQRDIKPAE